MDWRTRAWLSAWVGSVVLATVCLLASRVESIQYVHPTTLLFAIDGAGTVVEAPLDHPPPGDELLAVQIVKKCQYSSRFAPTHRLDSMTVAVYDSLDGSLRKGLAKSAVLDVLRAQYDVQNADVLWGRGQLIAKHSLARGFVVRGAVALLGGAWLVSSIAGFRIAKRECMARRFNAKGCCPQCGYPIVGLAVCPECGRRINAAPLSGREPGSCG